MSAAHRVTIIELNASQLSSYGAPPALGTLLRIVDLPQKPLFQWGGTMWLPIGGDIVLAQSSVAVSAPADANEDVLATINVPAGILGPNGALRITSLWTVTNSGNNKTLRARLGGAAGTQYMAQVVTAVASVSDQRAIQNRGAANSQVGGPSASTGFGSATGAVVTSAVDTSAASSVVLSGQKATAGETITLEGFLIEAIPAP